MPWHCIHFIEPQDLDDRRGATSNQMYIAYRFPCFKPMFTTSIFAFCFFALGKSISRIIFWLYNRMNIAYQQGVHVKSWPQTCGDLKPFEAVRLYKFTYICGRKLDTEIVWRYTQKLRNIFFLNRESLTHIKTYQDTFVVVSFYK